MFSAYDICADELGELKQALRQFQETGGATLMDSGGYEFSKFQNDVPAFFSSDFRARLHDETWNEQRYFETVEAVHCDCVFSFDYFPLPSEESSLFRKRLVGHLQQHGRHIDVPRLIPVIHLTDRKHTWRFSELDAVSLSTAIASELGTRIVAIPERELGADIVARVALAKNICQALSEEDVGLHILGCGNLLSFAAFAVAGVSMGDGLEWCQVLGGPEFSSAPLSATSALRSCHTSNTKRAC